MPTAAKKHSYKHYFPFVLFSNQVRQFATISPGVMKTNTQNVSSNRRHFTDNFPPLTYCFLITFQF